MAANFAANEVCIADVLIHSIGDMASAYTNGPAKARVMHDVIRISEAAIAIKNGYIFASGPERDVRKQIIVNESTQLIDASGKVVTAGLVDAHTHLIFAGSRANEFLMRCQGKTYSEIAKAGGGIVASMTATRNASEAELTNLAQLRLGRMLESGTTTCEIKTGYGLSAESELRMLNIIYELQSNQPIELVPTFMPAHALPPDYSKEQYITEIISDMLPKAITIAKRHNSNTNNLSILPFLDVFCDKGYFTLNETRTILEAGIKLGMRPKIHSDEFVNLGATKLAIELNATSVDHLLQVSQREIDLLSQSNTVGVLLPGTSFFLNLKEHAQARHMIDKGVAIALASDFNPGSSYLFSLPLIWGLACLHLGMTCEEALTALTANAAFAVGKGKTIGQIRQNYQADITIYDVPRLEEIPYNLGWNPVFMTIKRGKIVFSK